MGVVVVGKHESRVVCALSLPTTQNDGDEQVVAVPSKSTVWGVTLLLKVAAAVQLLPV